MLALLIQDPIIATRGIKILREVLRINIHVQLLLQAALPTAEILLGVILIADLAPANKTAVAIDIKEPAVRKIVLITNLQKPIPDLVPPVLIVAAAEDLTPHPAAVAAKALAPTLPQAVVQVEAAVVV